MRALGIARMPDYSRFEQVFPSGAQLPYDKKLQHEIDVFRKNLGGTLFVEGVLQALGISKSV